MTPSVEQPVAPNKVILSVGGESITAGELDRIVDALPEQFRAQVRGAGKRQFAENLVRIKLLSQEARRLKIDQSPAFLAQLSFQRDNLLAGLAYQQLSTDLKVDDAAARQYYEQHKSEYESAHARHILIRAKGSPAPAKPGQTELTEEEALAKAQAIRKRLAGGEDFAEVAKKESDDNGSAMNGGDLGTFKHGQMVPAFEQAAFSQPIGQVGEPVKTQFGYHLIKVDSREAKTFEEMRPEIEKRLRPELAQKKLEQMRQSSAVVIDEQYFGAAPPFPPAAPAVPAPPK